MSSEINRQDELLAEALAAAGKNAQLRSIMFEALREAELHADDPAVFREQVRWPLILSLLRDVSTHEVILEDGSIFEVAPDSRIEKALLLSTVAHPDHVRSAALPHRPSEMRITDRPNRLHRREWPKLRQPPKDDCA